MNYLLDTNVISELVSRQPTPTVVAWVDQLDPLAVHISVITIGEIQKGIQRLPPSRRRDKMSAWLEEGLLQRFQGRIAAVTIDVMLVWGTLVGRLENEGKPMPAIDSLLAAIALQGRYTLVTRNDGDFRHAGLQVINPWQLPLSR